MWQRFHEGARRPRAEQGGGTKEQRGKCLAWNHHGRARVRISNTDRLSDRGDCSPGIRTTWPSTNYDPTRTLAIALTGRPRGQRRIWKNWRSRRRRVICLEECKSADLFALRGCARKKQSTGVVLPSGACANLDRSRERTHSCEIDRGGRELSGCTLRYERAASKSVNRCWRYPLVNFNRSPGSPLNRSRR